MNRVELHKSRAGGAASHLIPRRPLVSVFHLREADGNEHRVGSADRELGYEGERAKEKKGDPQALGAAAPARRRRKETEPGVVIESGGAAAGGAEESHTATKQLREGGGSGRRPAVRGNG